VDARGIHDAAARGFERGAADYERGRPGYPAEAVELLLAELGVTAGSLVLDVAAGSGKFTRELVSRGVRVVAVEPVRSMRAALPPEIEALDGTAEEIPLADAAVDAVTVAQAFHWFDGDRALAEIHRVLRPGGRLGLIWNRRDQRSELQRELSAIVDPYRGDAPAYGTGAWREAFDRTRLFTPLEERHFPYAVEADGETLVARVTSISFIAVLPEEERARVVDRVRALGAGVLEYETDVYWCSRV
jgi:SAM-dependent methyltransferase